MPVRLWLQSARTDFPVCIDFGQLVHSPLLHLSTFVRAQTAMLPLFRRVLSFLIIVLRG